MRKSLATLTALAITAGGILGTTGPAQAAPAVRFSAAQYDSPGSDTRSNKSLNAEWISVVNTGTKAVSLKGWKIVDKSRTYTFGDVTIAGKGGKVTLHTGKGTNTKTHLYWGSGNYVWNNTGDAARLSDASGRTVDVCSWESEKGRARVAC